MFVHLGKGKTVSTEAIIGIFNVELAETSKATEEFLLLSEVERSLEDLSERGEGSPLSFIVTEETVYLSPLSTKLLEHRVEEEADNGRI